MYLEGDKYTEPYIDPGMVAKHLSAGSKSTRNRKKRDDDGAPDKAPFLPVVGKWAVYNAKTRSNANVKRFGAPYEYIDGPPRVHKRKIKDEEGRVIIK